ncbi:MAG: cell division protein FtsL [Pseudomonadota bacterium]
MKRMIFCVSVTTVIALAVWAYNVNYRTRQAFDRLDTLRAELAAERETVQVLRVEWAWLNAPDRLARLVALHNDRLRLAPMAPERYGLVSTVPFPPPVSLDERMMAELSEAARAAAGPAEEQLLVLDIPLPPVRPASWSRQ